MSRNSNELVDFPSLSGYLLGAGGIAWLAGGGITPLLVIGFSLGCIYRVLKELGD